MDSIENKIADLTGLLPRFIGTILQDYESDLPIKLNPREKSSLMFIKKYSGYPMNEYSKKVSISKSTLTYVADNLEKYGLIERKPMKHDRRKNALVLTKKGDKLAQTIIKQNNQHITKKISQLSQEQLKDLERALEVLVKTIDSIRKD